MTFEQFLDAVNRRRVLIAVILLLGIVLTMVVVSRLRPAYSAQSSVLMVAETVGESTQARPSPIKPILSGDLPLLATTPTVLDRVARDLRAPRDADGVEALGRAVKARLAASSAVAGSSGGVLVIAYTDQSESRAVAGANAFAAEVAAFYRQNATERFSTLVRDLDQQMALRRHDMQTQDARIQTIIAMNPYLDTKDGARSLNAQYEKLVSDRADAAALAQGDTAAAAVAVQRTQEVSAAAHRDITENDPTYHNLRDQYARDYAQLQRVRSQFSSSYPGIPELEHGVASERAAMLAQERKLRSLSPNASLAYANALGEANKARATASGDAARLRGISAALAETRDRISEGQGAGTRLASLLRDRDVAATAYTVLATRLAEAVANKAEAGSVGSVIVLDHALYAKRAGNRLLAIAVGLFATLFLAVLAVMVAENLDARLRTAAIAEGVYGVPVIGGIG